MTTTSKRRRGSTSATKRTVSSEANADRSRSKSRLPENIGNIIGMILLVVAAFAAGYLIGRAHPNLVSAISDSWAIHAPTTGEDGLDSGQAS